MTSGWYNREELLEMGFQSVGRDVLISKKCSIYGASKMSIGDNVRIDDFCLLSGDVKIGSYVHVAAYVGLNGGRGIRLGDFVSLSTKVSILSASDDFASGNFFTNPTVPEDFRNVKGGPVILEKHSIIGAGTIILPDLTIGEGAAVGAASLVEKSLAPWKLYVGVPCRPVKNRERGVLELEEKLQKRVGRP